MTMPYLSNCPHHPDAWCLACVQKLWEEAHPPQPQIDWTLIPAYVRSLVKWVAKDEKVGVYGYVRQPRKQICLGHTDDPLGVWVDGGSPYRLIQLDSSFKDIPWDESLREIPPQPSR